MKFLKTAAAAFASSVFGVCLVAPLCSAESIEDGYLMRNDAPVVLKSGGRIQCESFLWLTKSADFIQCNRADGAVEIQIDQVDMEKTFGPEIAEEFKKSRSRLKESYSEEKKKMEENVISIENTPAPQTVLSGEGDADKNGAKTAVGTEPEKAIDPGTRERAEPEPAEGPEKIDLSKEQKRGLRAELKKCCEDLKNLEKQGPPDRVPPADQVRLRREGLEDVTPGQYWERNLRQLEDRCERIKRRLRGWDVPVEDK